MKTISFMVLAIAGLLGSASASLKIVEINGKSPDFVVIQNAGSAAVDLGGYILAEDDASWTFPKGTKLAAGATVKVYCFSRKKSRSKGELFAKKYKGDSSVLVSIEFGISEGETVELKNSAGAVISSAKN